VVTLHTSVLMVAFVSMYQSTTFWYPPCSRSSTAAAGVPAALERRGVIGSVFFGALSSAGAAGARRHGGMLAGLASAPVFLFSGSQAGLLLGRG